MKEQTKEWQDFGIGYQFFSLSGLRKEKKGDDS
jgi:hypothetical protein